MSFDSATRNRLASFVKEARTVITDEFTQQFQALYGISPSGEITPLGQLGHLDEKGLTTAALLRERIDYLIKTQPSEKNAEAQAVARLAREQAFTILNRLAAIRMAEKRKLIIESVGKGYQSAGFRIYEKIAETGLGDSYHRYRFYLFCLFDELAVDLGVLFARHSPSSLLFPRETSLLRLLELLNAPELDALWEEDETIGWIYQYFNDPTERKKMREESSAPRNSRELAVRNQFFTPRYVVEFLTDNTLGRIWYEMTQGDTTLKEQCRYLVRRPNEIFLKTGETAPEQPKQDNLSQEDLLKQPVFIPHRPLKDPRTILMLDPACGSMHFGLYAFDLFEVIYDEAWALEEKLGADALSRPPGMKSLHDTYAGKDAFLKDVPRLIIEHNLHGIDIDPRCAQIAGLSLWLRAQKAWQRLGLKPAERPAIKRSNIVCAEPMPGEKELLREFVEREFPAAERAVCLRLLEAIFDKMQLAGEAGSLLKIEEEIRSAIEDARDAWQKLATRPPELFTTTELNQLSTAPELTGLEQAVSSLTTDPRPLTTDFWERIEERIYAALRDYAEQAENGGGFQRRLFAEDAARGFAFIDVCGKRYDVALMNPPFGQFPVGIEQAMRTVWRSHANDIYVPFILWSSSRLADGGRIGAISSRNFLIGRDQREFRPLLLGKGVAALDLFVDLGLQVLDGAEVDTATYVVSARPFTPSDGCCYWDFRKEQRDELHALATLLAEHHSTFRLHTNFWNTPANLIAYSASVEELADLSSGNHLDPELGRVTKGLSSSDDFRFLRLMWEPREADIGKRWIYCAKGADYSWIISNITTVVDWLKDGELIAAYAAEVGDNIAQARRSSAYYFLPALTHTYRCDDFSLRALPAGCIFTNGSPVISPKDETVMPDVLALFLSRRFEKLLSYVSKKGLYETGRVGLLPAPPRRYAAESSDQWKQLVRYLMLNELSVEHSAYFVMPAGWGVSLFDGAQCKQLFESFGALSGEEVSAGFIERGVVGFADRYVPSPSSSTEWLSYSFGIAFGRWDIRYATGEQAAPELPDPFAPLPVCPPGQLQNAQGLPARPEDVPAAYPVRIPWDGILVDDPNHPLDVERRVREVIEIIWSGQEGGPTAEAIEHEACEILGVKSLRDYFRKPAGFFADHLKRYSKSRRQAPIYWPLSTASGSYTLWIYYHRLTDQTLHTVQADFLGPKIRDVQSQIRELLDTNGSRTKLDELRDFERELTDLSTEIDRIIRLPWKPNLNDGVLITAAPLWKLFRLGKWQKDLAACWKDLESGEYDWAHLAYTIWPDRVRQKCRKDRSLAIAHGLESICEIEAPKPKAKKSSRKSKGNEPLI